jgi:hypothetical protein
VDHIVSEKHNGPTHENNLAYSCLYCNLNKGTDLGSFIRGTQKLVRFFNPRSDRWSDHFELRRADFEIIPLTKIGEVTVRIFAFNTRERKLERRALHLAGRFPSPAALMRMR